MDVKQRIQAFVQLGRQLSYFKNSQPWPGYESGLGEDEYEHFSSLLPSIKHHNGWFTEEEVRRAIAGITHMLDAGKLQTWTSRYDLDRTGGKQVGIIMAGNIPMVGFHDLMCVLLSGHTALVKLSSDDDLLIPAVLEILFTIEPGFKERVVMVDRKMEGQEAMIATGSNNSARYFEQYFGHLPHIIRKNRTSVAWLTGEETDAQLAGLTSDIFDFFGLGCRNVSKLLVSNDYDLDTFFTAVFPRKDIINHVKYANNYDYHKAIYLMNGEDLVENGFLLVKETENLHSPLGVLFVQRFSDEDEMREYVSAHASDIQCVVSATDVPFGKAQTPEVWDYADGVDTLEFLSSL